MRGGSGQLAVGASMWTALELLDLSSGWGHLHESGKISGDHANAIRDIASRRFKFTPVNEFPASAAAWHAKAKAVLQKSRPTGDLTLADEAYILAIDNANWDDQWWEHLCLGPERCCARLCVAAHLSVETF